VIEKGVKRFTYFKSIYSTTMHDVLLTVYNWWAGWVLKQLVVYKGSH